MVSTTTTDQTSHLQSDNTTIGTLHRDREPHINIDPSQIHHSSANEHLAKASLALPYLSASHHSRFRSQPDPHDWIGFTSSYHMTQMNHHRDLLARLPSSSFDGLCQLDLPAGLLSGPPFSFVDLHHRNIVEKPSQPQLQVQAQSRSKQENDGPNHRAGSRDSCTSSSTSSSMVDTPMTSALYNLPPAGAFSVESVSQPDGPNVSYHLDPARGVGTRPDDQHVVDLSINGIENEYGGQTGNRDGDGNDKLGQSWGNGFLHSSMMDNKTAPTYYPSFQYPYPITDTSYNPLSGQQDPAIYFNPALLSFHGMGINPQMINPDPPKSMAVFPNNHHLHQDFQALPQLATARDVVHSQEPGVSPDYTSFAATSPINSTASSPPTESKQPKKHTRRMSDTAALHQPHPTNKRGRKRKSTWTAGDDGIDLSAITDKKERRRMQNRLAQRAFRARSKMIHSLIGTLGEQTH